MKPTVVIWSVWKMRTTEVDALVEEETALRQELNTLFEDESQSARQVLTDFVERITQEGVSLSDVAWLNAAYGKYLPTLPDPNAFSDYPSRLGVTQITTLVRGLLYVP